MQLQLRQIVVLLRRSRLWQGAVVLSLLVGVVIFCPKRRSQSREDLYREVVKLVMSADTKPDLWLGRQACNRPEIDAFNVESSSHFAPVPPVACAGENDWVEVDGNVASVTAEARRRHGKIKCEFTPLKRLTEFLAWPDSSPYVSDHYNFTDHDFARVICFGKSGAIWANLLAGARLHNDITHRTGWDQVPPRALGLNVLMFGFGSVSRLNFIKKLYKSYHYLVEELGGVVLEGYNIVGDGTSHELIPILTGKTELELPEARIRMENAININSYPFIWNDFKDAGYVTGFMEDHPSHGVFTSRLKGFSNPPTDHYMRTFYVEAMQRYSNLFSNLCLGSRPRHKVMMDYIKSVFKVYRNRPKFVFGFHREMSQISSNSVGAADGDLLTWLKWFKAMNHSENTVLVLMSDHGWRRSVHSSQQGKLEERLPFFSFVFPPWFGKRFPEAMENLKTNVHRLTTPFDIHATLKSILHQPTVGMGSVSERGISLFKEVPLSRTCVDAFIEPHWCACMEWKSFDKNDPVVAAAGEDLVTFINTYVGEYTDQCQILRLRQVTWVAQLVPTRAFITYKKSKDPDGFVPNMEGYTHVTITMFYLQIVTDPGLAVFEAAVTYNSVTRLFTHRISSVNRVNEYRHQGTCMNIVHKHLRKFCFCKNI